ncbi:hypothetical protein [Gimibacter soli]|uniref:Uncharacterized protein n=1 Tax=Gimibacter soli TaxID=3024400 RepID=A0AAE9XKJ4_9PROT|nr:hypothetical protein [Gimibacter soli]WCL52879.1 hypothetical protein PH603_10045 [Gimibacter soli]
MEPLFPVPRVTESFIDGIIKDLGWHRYEELMHLKAGRKNADYIGPNAVLELKLIEKEGILEPGRQDKVAKIFDRSSDGKTEIDIDLDSVDVSFREAIEEIISKPLQGPLKKASAQIKDTRADLNAVRHAGILIVVNNGYSYLTHENFCKLIIDRVRRDSSQIDYAFCITPSCHQGGLGIVVHFQADCLARQEIGSNKWTHEVAFREKLMDRYGDAMTAMMRDQLNPEFWDNRLDPIRDIVFEREGIRYIRRAPGVPDSQFR